MSEEELTNGVGVDLAEETKAMQSIAEAVKGLDARARARVIEWAASAVGVAVRQAGSGTGTGGGGGTAQSDAGGLTVYEDVASVFDAAAPKTEVEKVLIVAAWLQEAGGQRDLDASAINAALKNLGHRVSNITNVFSRLMERKPAWAIQVRKAGNTKQARKKYRVTGAGLKEVKRMLMEGSTEDGGEE